MSFENKLKCKEMVKENFRSDLSFETKLGLIDKCGDILNKFENQKALDLCINMVKENFRSDLNFMDKLAYIGKCHDTFDEPSIEFSGTGNAGCHDQYEI
jgi:hypothetical protein